MADNLAPRALLEHIRSIKQLLHSVPTHSAAKIVTTSLGDALEAQVYLVAADGRLLDSSTQGATDLAPDLAHRLGRLDDSTLSGEEEYPNIAIWAGSKHLAAIPVMSAGRRVATLLAGRGRVFGQADQILLEYGAALAGLEMLRQGNAAQEADVRRRGAVEQALGALSYSEQEAVRVLFENLEGEEGVVVASRIADSVGLTRSVIVNALRKLESAGVITSRSLGMKGTYVKVLNRELVPAVKNSAL